MRKLAFNSKLLLGAVRSNASKLVWWLLDKGAKIDSEIDGHDCCQLLLEAIKLDHADIFKLLLEQGADTKSSHGDTPLHVAVKYSSADAVRSLLDRRGNPSAKNERGETPLHIAAREGNSAIVSMLLNSGSDVNSKSNKRETPLHMAVLNEDIDTMITLLEHGASISAANCEKTTPVHLAALWGPTPELLATLLKNIKRSCDLDLRDEDGNTALHIAVVDDSSAKVAMLLEKGANVLATDKGGETPIHWAARYGTLEPLATVLKNVKRSCDLDLRNENGDTALHLAIINKSVAKVAMLLEKGADVLTTNTSKETSIHCAARCSTSEILHKLLSYVKNPSAFDLRDKYNDTALHLAISEVCPFKVKILLESGANVLTTGLNDMTSIHLAARDSESEILAMLLEHAKQPSDLDLRDMYGHTALHIVISTKYPSKVRMLLESGANFLATTNFRETSIHLAARYSTSEILAILLEYVKRSHYLDLYDSDGNTPLHLAVRANSAAMVKMLLKKGADFTMLNPITDKSALDMALSLGGEEIRELGRRCQRSLEMGSSQLLPDPLELPSIA